MSELPTNTETNTETPAHAALKWDQDGERFYHTGVSKGVIYRLDSSNEYTRAEAWNGLTGVEENPDGADVTDLWADNMKYASFRSAENYKGTIKAYMYPDLFEECNGGKMPVPGMRIGQQKRKSFGLCYRTEIGNDTNSDEDDGYILHLVYGATVSPSSVSHDTINDNPDAVEFSWDYECLPVAVNEITGVKQTCSIELNSLDLGETAMAAIEAALYGSSAGDAYLPLPDEVYEILTDAGVTPAETAEPSEP